MERDDLLALGQDIKANGLRDPFVFWAPGANTQRPHPEFMLLDGRCRLDACELVGLEVVIDVRDPAMPVVSIAGCDVLCATPHSSYVFELRTVDGEQSPRPWIDPFAYVLSRQPPPPPSERRTETRTGRQGTQGATRQVEPSHRAAGQGFRQDSCQGSARTYATFGNSERRYHHRREGPQTAERQGRETRLDRALAGSACTGGRRRRPRLSLVRCSRNLQDIRSISPCAPCCARSYTNMALDDAPRACDVPGDTLFNDLPSQTWRFTDD